MVITLSSPDANRQPEGRRWLADASRPDG